MTMVSYHVAKNPILNLSSRELIYYNYSVSNQRHAAFFYCFYGLRSGCLSAALKVAMISMQIHTTRRSSYVICNQHGVRNLKTLRLRKAYFCKIFYHLSLCRET